jgi:DNA-binding response OmpR family regulator
MKAILIADDGIEQRVLSQVLQLTNIDVIVGYRLEESLATWSDAPADLLLLTASLEDPISTVHNLRSITIVPLILVQEPLDEILHVKLLDAGADLVLSRPFSVRLLASQIRTLFRRSNSIPLPSLPILGEAGLRLDPISRIVTVGQNAPCHLTHLEFRLLYTLATHKGQVLTTNTLIERVWGYADAGNNELVRGLVSRLRAKIEKDPREPKYIVTVPGTGYVFLPHSIVN